MPSILGWWQSYLLIARSFHKISDFLDVFVKKILEDKERFSSGDMGGNSPDYGPVSYTCLDGARWSSYSAS